MSTLHRPVTLITAATILSLLALAVRVQAADPPGGTAAETARIDTFVKPSGEGYFALSLRPAIELPPAEAHDIVVLFDTSASQTGVYRQKALTALQTLLKGLGSNDRVNLLAVDLDTVPMSEAFDSPTGPQMQQALNKLAHRAPLGSTDMAKALKAAIGSWEKGSNASRRIVYLGDGMSTANLLESQQFADLTAALVQQRTPVSCYAVGPRVDTPLLAALANHTGGNLAVAQAALPEDAIGADADVSVEQARAENLRHAETAGKFLANSVSGTVLWPTDVKYPASFEKVYPAVPPPLRSDRDTVVIGVGRVNTDDKTEEVHVQMTAALHGRDVPLDWQVKPGQPNPDNAYLVQLVDRAAADRGATLPTIGTAGLHEMRRMADATVEDLTRLARHATSTGNLSRARLLAEQALARDPGNLEAEAVRGAVDRMENDPKSGGVELRLVKLADPDAPPTPKTDQAPPLPDEVADQGKFLDAIQNMNRVITEQMEKEVEVLLGEARGLMADNPTGVIEELKLLQEKVRTTPELDPDVRSQLTNQIESALKEAARREVELTERNRAAEEAIAAAQVERQIADRLRRTQDETKLLMERFNALTDDRLYPQADEVATILAEKLGPEETIGRSALVDSRLAMYHAEQEALRAAKQQAYVDTLMTVEESSIPFPDVPPIIYPPRSDWEELTARRKKWAGVDLKKPGSAEEKIRNALEETTPPLEFIETPLRDVLQYIKDAKGIEIVIDQPSLEAVGFSPETPVSIELKGIRLRSALRLMLRNMQLTYIIKDEVLLITTPEVAEQELTTIVYPVADLVLPIPDLSSFGGGGGIGGGIGGGLGGGGGGFGGGGGGLGGGGFGGGGLGGGGGGFGGGGLGGGGGGFFNVRDEVPNETRAKEDQKAPASSPQNDKPLKLTRRSDASPGLTTEEITAPNGQIGDRSLDGSGSHKADDSSLPIAIDPAVPAEAFWDNYFNTHRPSARVVRQTARGLIQEKRFEETIALLQAALRHGQSQAWMYEALGLAMQLAGRPDDEIERALMSAADFADGPDSLLYLAQYMSRIGRSERALDLYQQVARIDPHRHEPYALAMKIAKRENHDQALRWSTLGVLKEAWPDRQADIVDSARRLALDLVERLKASGQTEEAEAFRQELNTALTRDVVIRVTWTGDADIDLMVEEPTGTVCSLRSPRTNGGGVILGDGTPAHRDAEGTYSETYVCPFAFAGDYRVAIRRVWGRVTAGKVNVLVVTNYRAGEQRHEQQQISVGDKDALVAFKLDHGRRTQPVDDQRLANAAVGQVEVGRAVLAQQLGEGSDPAVAAALAASRGQPFVTGLTPVVRGGAVGYQPVIQRFPQGTQYFVTGVISADRRYVRISGAPTFNAIGDVSTFTFSGAAQQVDANNNGGGAGGLGGALGGGGGGGGGGFGGGGIGF